MSKISRDKLLSDARLYGFNEPTFELFVFEGTRHNHDCCASVKTFFVHTSDKNKAEDIAKNPWAYRNDCDFCKWDRLIHYKIGKDGVVTKRISRRILVKA